MLPLLLLAAAFGALAGVGIRLSFGIPTVVAGHVLWNLSLVILVVRARMAGMDRTLVEASADLFATPWRTFTGVTLPQLAPAILAGALLSFTFSMDDVVLSTFLSGVGSTTLPMRVFSITNHLPITREDLEYLTTPDLLSHIMLMSTKQILEFLVVDLNMI